MSTRGIIGFIIYISTLTLILYVNETGFFDQFKRSSFTFEMELPEGLSEQWLDYFLAQFTRKLPIAKMILAYTFYNESIYIYV